MNLNLFDLTEHIAFDSVEWWKIIHVADPTWLEYKA